MSAPSPLPSSSTDSSPAVSTHSSESHIVAGRSGSGGGSPVSQDDSSTAASHTLPASASSASASASAVGAGSVSASATAAAKQNRMSLAVHSYTTEHGRGSLSPLLKAMPSPSLPPAAVAAAAPLSLAPEEFHGLDGGTHAGDARVVSKSDSGGGSAEGGGASGPP